VLSASASLTAPSELHSLTERRRVRTFIEHQAILGLYARQNASNDFYMRSSTVQTTYLPNRRAITAFEPTNRFR